MIPWTLRIAPLFGGIDPKVCKTTVRLRIKFPHCIVSAMLQALDVFPQYSPPLTLALSLATIPFLGSTPVIPILPYVRRASFSASSSIISERSQLNQQEPQQWPTSQARTQTTDTARRLQVRIHNLEKILSKNLRTLSFRLSEML